MAELNPAGDPILEKGPGTNGIWTFVFIDMLVFLMFFLVYLSERHRVPDIFIESQHHLTPWVALLSTVALLTSSWCVAESVHATRRGDALAAMGHGELSATGLEMAAETTISVELTKSNSKKLAGPRIETPTEIVTVATGCPMERSIAEAYAQLILWMEEDFGWNRWKAYDVLTHVGRISVGYYGIGTVGTKIEKKYLAAPTSV